ncbi:MAG: HAD hydrolase-like protein [Duncaniella sp.]|nr:HAD hydrolase-like protein [Duncaniella sp.]
MNNRETILRYLSAAGVDRFVPRAALIDMDGTLYDSMPNHATAWHTLATENGIPSTREEFFLYEGATGAYTLCRLFNRAFGRDATPEEISRLYKRKTELFAMQPAVGLMPGAKKLLDFFKAAGTKRIVVTGSGQDTVISRLTTDFAGLIEATDIITARDVKKGKPDPEPYIMGMKRAGAVPSESIVIENAPLGVTAGHRSGAFTVGVTTGPVPRVELEKAGADIVYDSMEECAEMMPGLFREMAVTTRS